MMPQNFSFFRLLAFLLTTTILIFACQQPDIERASDSDYGRIGGISGNELNDVQELHKSNGSEPQTLDPHRAEGVPAANILRDLFEPLVMESPTGELVPGAASNWEVSDDGLVYTFFLRPDSLWSNGDQVTAQDFVFGMRRALDPKTLSSYASILYPILNAEKINLGEMESDALGVKALNDLTLEIRLVAPTSYFLGLLNHNMAYALHPESVKQFSEKFSRAGNLISNGAYVLKDWVIQSHIVLERNQFFRENSQTIIDKVTYYAIEDSNAVFKRYRAGELDFTQSIPARQLDWIEKNIPSEYFQSPYLGSYYFGFNTSKPPFKGRPGLRRALSMVIDRKIITDKLTRAGEQPAYGWIPPVKGYEQQKSNWASWTMEQRISKARNLYHEAGYSDQKPLTVEIIYNTSQDHKRLAIAIAAMWNETLGVQARLLNQEWKVFLQTRQSKINTQVFRAGWIGDFNDPYTFAQLLHSQNAQNDFGWYSQEYDSLLDGAAKEIDLLKRAQLLQEAERLLLNEAPLMPIYFYVSKHLIKPWVSGFEKNLMDHTYTKDLAILKH
ncbi:MAG: peptide ABC transporter substrate-binding protein [Pseudomonadota bacterium]|nr:peptide ABC transporter substrate-binding protein [Pseudomonadota bacterium]